MLNLSVRTEDLELTLSSTPHNTSRGTGAAEIAPRAAVAERDNPRHHGVRLAYLFDKKHHAFLDEIDLKKATCLIGIPNGGSSGVLYSVRSGESYWTNFHTKNWPRVPELLLQMKCEHCRPVSIALGTYGRYFLKFANGQKYWRGPDIMDEVLLTENISMVAFGERLRSYVILLEDGRVKYNEIPERLEEKVKSRTPEFVSMGPSGQWFVRFEGGANMDWFHEGVSDKVGDYIMKQVHNGIIREISFTETGVIIRYNPYN